jgi:hypothetical protein
MVELLLQPGADPNRRIERDARAGGMVPLSLAKDALTANVLLQAGARVDLPDKRAMTPADWMRFRQLSEVVDTLERFTATTALV